MEEQRNEYQLYDNLIPSSLIPKRKVERDDVGVLKREIKSVVPQEGSTNFGESHTQKASFRWNFKACELLRDAKLRGKIKITGGTKASIDGNMKALFSQVQLQKTNGPVIEQIERANRYIMSNEVAVMNQANCDLNWADWSDSYYKADSATAGASGNSNKRHITATAQDFEIYLADLLNFPRKNHCWFSFAQDGLDLVFSFDKNKNILTYNDSASVIVITDLYLDIPVYFMNEAYYSEVAKQPIIQNFSGVRLFSVKCDQNENHISIPVGVNNLIGVKILFRDSSEENGTVATTPATSQKRYLTKSVNPAITSFQMRLGDLQFPDRPILSSYQLHDYLKEFHLIHHDSDVGNLLNVWNYNDPSTSTQATLDTTDMLYLGFNLSKNGLNTGLQAKDTNLEIDISCTQTDNLIADVFCLYSKVAQTVDKEMRLAY